MEAQGMLKMVSAAIRADIERQLGVLGYVSPAIDDDGEETGYLVVDGKIDLQSITKAAIKAMREPSKEMIDAGYTEINNCIDHYCYDSGSGYTLEAFAPTSAWQTMIDAALNEQEKG